MDLDNRDKVGGLGTADNSSLFFFSPEVEATKSFTFGSLLPSIPDVRVDVRGKQGDVDANISGGVKAGHVVLSNDTADCASKRFARGLLILTILEKFPEVEKPSVPERGRFHSKRPTKFCVLQN